jgi:diguanylate cyclase (GGDEF)-like protein
LREGVRGAVDRAGFGHSIKAVLDWTQSEQRNVGVVFVELDGADDAELLSQATERLAGIVRSGDAVARLGGDEFAVILSDVSDHDVVHAAADRARGVFAEPFQVGDALLSVTPGVDEALWPEGLSGAVTLAGHM